MSDSLVRADAERSTLRLRLAAAALASTVLLLAPSAGWVPAATVVAYAAIAAVLFVTGVRERIPLLSPVGTALDIAFVTILVVLSPIGPPVWIIYALAIGVAAQRHGTNGALVATATSLVCYDIALLARAGETPPHLVWAIQVLVAVGLIAMELSWARRRDTRERATHRAQLLALKAVAARTDVPALLDALTLHAYNLGDASAAWVWLRRPNGVYEVVAERGAVPARARETTPEALEIRSVVIAHLTSDGSAFLGAALTEGERIDRRAALVRDLARDAGPLLAGALERARIAEREEVNDVAFGGIAQIARGADPPAVLAELTLAASRISGPVAIVRAADSSVLSGDLPREPLVLLARGIAAPALLHRDGRGHWTEDLLAELEAASASLSPVGEGRILVALSRGRAMEQSRHKALLRLSEAARSALEAIADRDARAAAVAAIRGVIEAAPVPMIAWDANGDVAVMSRAYGALFASQPLPAPLGLAPGAAEDREVVIELEGKRYVFHAHTAAAKAENLRYVSVLCDVTREREELKARDEAVLTAAHELRTPLSAVHGWAQLMSRNLGSIHGQVAQLDRLISDLLTTGRSQYGHLEIGEVDLPEIVKEAAQRARQTLGATVTLQGVRRSLRVRADRMRVGQVLDNLLQNAAKYSAEGSVIEVAVTLEEPEAIVRVRDHGIGIAPEDFPFIFDRFYRGARSRETTGTGVGLFVAREIVLAHGGRIWAESEGAGRGSTFVVTLPLASVTATARPPALER